MSVVEIPVKYILELHSMVCFFISLYMYMYCIWKCIEFGCLLECKYFDCHVLKRA